MAKKKGNKSAGESAASRLSVNINKKRKLERHLKRFPNDDQAAIALANVGSFQTKAGQKRRSGRVTSPMIRVKQQTTGQKRVVGRATAKVNKFLQQVAEGNAAIRKFSYLGNTKHPQWAFFGMEKPETKMGYAG